MKHLSNLSSTTFLAAIVGLILVVSQSGCYSTGANTTGLAGMNPFQPRQFSQQSPQFQANYPPPFGQPPFGQAFAQQPVQPPQGYTNPMQSGFTDPYAQQPAANQIGFQNRLNPFGLGRC